MLTGLVSNVRGFVSGLVRGAVRAGISAADTFGELAKVGLDYARSQFEIDYQAFDIQQGLCDAIRKRPTDQLIPAGWHKTSDWDLAENFKYDLTSTYEDVFGNTIEAKWSVTSDRRLTPEEIAERGEEYAEEYAPEGFPFHSTPELVGSWVREDWHAEVPFTFARD